MKLCSRSTVDFQPDGNFSACPDRQRRKQLVLKSKGISSQTLEKPVRLFNKTLNVYSCYEFVTFLFLPYRCVLLFYMVVEDGSKLLFICFTKQKNYCLLLPKTFLHQPNEQ